MTGVSLVVTPLCVDEDYLCLVVRTSVANRDGGFDLFIHMLASAK